MLVMIFEIILVLLFLIWSIAFIKLIIDDYLDNKRQQKIAFNIEDELDFHEWTQGAIEKQQKKEKTIRSEVNLQIKDAKNKGCVHFTIFLKEPTKGYDLDEKNYVEQYLKYLGFQVGWREHHLKDGGGTLIHVSLPEEYSQEVHSKSWKMNNVLKEIEDD